MKSLSLSKIILSVLALCTLMVSANAVDREYVKTKKLAATSRQVSIAVNVSGTGVAAIPMGVSGTVTRISAVLMGAMAGTQSIVTPTINGISMGSAQMVVPSSSTPLTGVVSSSVTVSNTFKPGDVIGFAAGAGLTSNTAVGAGGRTHVQATLTYTPSY